MGAAATLQSSGRAAAQLENLRGFAGWQLRVEAVEPDARSALPAFASHASLAGRDDHAAIGSPL